MKTTTALFTLALCVSIHAENIPGLMPVDVYLNLEAKGFTTEKKLAGGTSQQFSEFICRKEEGLGSFTATAYSPKESVSKVAVVSAVVQTAGVSEGEMNALASSFLGFIASLPYQGSEPAAARAWVAATVGQKKEKVFGGVKFQLFANGATRILRISMDAPEKPAAPVIQKIQTILPEAGRTFADVVREHGQPTIRDADTGWAIWPGFKVKFKDGAVVEASKS